MTAPLAELLNWKSLKYLDLQDTKVTATGLDALRKAKPGLVILTTLAAAACKAVEPALDTVLECRSPHLESVT